MRSITGELLRRDLEYAIYLSRSGYRPDGSTLHAACETRDRGAVAFALRIGAPWSHGAQRSAFEWGDRWVIDVVQSCNPYSLAAMAAADAAMAGGAAGAGWGGAMAGAGGAVSVEPAAVAGAGATVLVEPVVVRKAELTLACEDHNKDQLLLWIAEGKKPGTSTLAEACRWGDYDAVKAVFEAGGRAEVHDREHPEDRVLNLAF